MKRIILSALLVFLALPLAGATTQKQRQIQPCEEKPSQAEASACAYHEYQAADAELNKVYGRLAAKLEADEKSLLKDSELAWIKYRDSNCGFESSFFKGGTMRPMIESLCLARVTKVRTAELKQQLDSFQQ
ncbi:MAG: hypothetical protein QOC99_3178 [Acidobacteriota bacterium]|jgi:uncharacterized protein YecT (DUF1311 family)|nr:hypothetical protein [Acidobacteriota bacterium]MDT7780666.1 hypothetical protein [Acidobacteriota bacterium]